MVVVADTSVLINLCRVQHDWLLPELFGDVWIPPAVASEFDRLALQHLRFQGTIMPDWVKRSGVVDVPAAVSACPNLDQGETEALALALQLHADFILVDDLAARKAATMLHQAYTGIGGILIRAKVLGLIQSATDSLNRLEAEARFFISPEIRQQILKLAGE